MENKSIAIIGGGPAGLRVAEILSASGLAVSLFDQKPSVGRKFLVAGRGGLNITHSESVGAFSKRYTFGHLESGEEYWSEALRQFSPQDLRKWVESFGMKTFEGSSHRVYPEGDSSAKLLRSWVSRLKKQGVSFFLKHRWVGFKEEAQGWKMIFEHDGGEKTVHSRVVVFAMGGGSWPETGSDGGWIPAFQKMGITVSPLASANCGWEVDWEPWFLGKFEGEPLKNVEVRTLSSEKIRGELMVTRYGLEGTPIYTLTRDLRGEKSPRLLIDLKPDLTKEELRKKFKSQKGFLKDIERAWKLSPLAKAFLLRGNPERNLEVFLNLVKACPMELKGPRPLEEAISSAGGVVQTVLNSQGMILDRPGLYCVGEMVDWEAPTGGYLLQGCFSGAARVADGVKEYLG